MFCACWVIDNVSYAQPQSGGFWSINLGDLGGFVAAAAAIGLAWFGYHRDDRRRPKLHLYFDPAQTADDYLDNTRVPGAGAHYVRMRIRNENGRDTAENVEVLVLSMRHEDNGAPVAPGGYAFRWSNVPPDGDQPRTKLDLPAGLDRHFDLIAMNRPYVTDGIGGFEPAGPGGTGAADAVLQVYPTPADDSHSLSAGKYKLEIGVTAKNADTISATVRIEFDGVTAEAAEVRDHLKVSV